MPFIQLVSNVRKLSPKRNAILLSSLPPNQMHQESSANNPSISRGKVNILIDPSEW